MGLPLPAKVLKASGHRCGCCQPPGPISGNSVEENVRIIAPVNHLLRKKGIEALLLDETLQTRLDKALGGFSVKAILL